MNFKDIKIMIGTPIHQDVKAEYMISLLETVYACEASDVWLEQEFVLGSSIIEDARNDLVKRFMDSECTHLLFIDSDISWSVNDIRELIKYSDNEKYLIVGGTYPKKEIDYEWLKKYIKSGYNIDDIENQIGLLNNDMFRPINQENNGILKVKHLPMGFVMINKRVFIEFEQKYKNLKYYRDNEWKYWYFHNEREYGEDTNFCKMYREINGNIWLIPWLELSHIGNFKYKRNIKGNKLMMEV